MRSIDKSESEVINIIKECGDSLGVLSCIINKMKKIGYTKPEIDKKLLAMRDKELIRLEVGTPIGRSDQELKEITISTNKNRFNYAKVVR